MLKKYFLAGMCYYCFIVVANTNLMALIDANVMNTAVTIIMCITRIKVHSNNAGHNMVEIILELKRNLGNGEII